MGDGAAAGGETRWEDVEGENAEGGRGRRRARLAPRPPGPTSCGGVAFPRREPTEDAAPLPGNCLPAQRNPELPTQGQHLTARAGPWGWIQLNDNPARGPRRGEEDNRCL